MTDLLEIFRELLRIEGQRDSLELGTPSKGGTLKIYADFSDLEATKDKIRKAFEARAFARELVEKGFEEDLAATLRATEAAKRTSEGKA